MSKGWKVLLTIVALGCFAVAISYPIRYRMAEKSTVNTMEQLIAMRDEDAAAAQNPTEVPETEAQPEEPAEQPASEGEPEETEKRAQPRAEVEQEEEPTATETAPEGDAVPDAEEAKPVKAVEATVPAAEPGEAVEPSPASAAPEGTERPSEEAIGAPEAERPATERSTPPQASAAPGGVERPREEAIGAPEAERPATERSTPPQASAAPEGTEKSEEAALNAAEKEHPVSVASEVASTATPTPTPTPKPTPTPVPTVDPLRMVRFDALPYPELERRTLNEDEILPEYLRVYELNTDFVGWITIPDTVIDYPVVQCEDSEFYLSHDFFGQENNNGQIILDPLCDPYTPSYNLIISGHNMKSDLMFGTLDEYRDKNFWKKHMTLSFNTLMERKEYVVFAAFYSADYDVDEAGFRYNVDIQYWSEAQNWFEEIRKNQLYDTEIDIEFGDEFLTLTTCNKAKRKDGRFVVVCRRIREGEEFK